MKYYQKDKALDYKIRPAIVSDSRFIAEMIELSSDGIASLEWQNESKNQAGVSAIDIGSQQYASDEGDYSYRNCLIAETDSPIGMILSFPMTKNNISTDAKPPPYQANDVFAPYKYLEAIDSWYICGVAVKPQYRKQGIATNLIKQSIKRGRQQGFNNTSLVAMYNKMELITFYQSLGFKITRSAPIVEHPKIRANGDAVLMETCSNNTTH